MKKIINTSSITNLFSGVTTQNDEPGKTVYGTTRVAYRVKQ